MGRTSHGFRLGRHSSTRWSRCLLLFVLTISIIVQGVTNVGASAPPEGFAHPAIKAVWQRDDGNISKTGTWLWGPGPFYTNYEPYREASEGNHLVQYFDKGRLEINNPNGDTKSLWFTTSGLLVREMVSGNAQVGDSEYYRLGPANIAVAGDPDNPNNPTYADFQNGTARSPRRDTGQSIPVAAGKRNLNTLPPATPFGGYEQTTGHNWAEVFFQFANSTQRPSGFNWLYTLGFPITDPVWEDVTINGQDQWILVQLFERRTLTYNPANPPATQMEMGNVGRHYYRWRYDNLHAADLNSVYQVRATVGPAPQRATHVEETVAVTNSTGQPLDRIIFRAVWHNRDGVLTLQSASAQGQTVQAKWTEGVNLEVMLPKPLASGERVSVSLSFDLKPRPVGGRTGYDRSNDILCLGDMLPTVVPWQNGGWAYYPYSDLGDLGYYDSSEYTVEINATGGERLIVGGTGDITEVDQARTHWKFHAANVRDAAYIISPRFMDPLTEPSMARKQGTVTYHALFLPEHKTDGIRQLDLVTGALGWYSKTIGAYPFDTYTVAEMGVPLEHTDNYAQEYPMSYWMPSGWLRYGVTPGEWTWYIPFHEVGHQWFYSTIGSNQLIDPWMDEASTSYISAEYVRLNFPELYPQAWRSMTANATRAMPVSAGVFSGFANESQYSAAIYDSGLQMLDRVRRAMGDGPFYAALQDYYRKFQFKRANPADLTGILQAHSQADLKAIFSAYLNY